MTLKDIAEEIEVNESTVSRAINDKYAETPIGKYPLKYFSKSGVGSEIGEVISSESIRVMIEELIDSEDKLKPFSDKWISDILNEKGINISRRTVDKYRDELGITSSTRQKDTNKLIKILLSKIYLPGEFLLKNLIKSYVLIQFKDSLLCFEHVIHVNFHLDYLSIVHLKIAGPYE